MRRVWDLLGMKPTGWFYVTWLVALSVAFSIDFAVPSPRNRLGRLALACAPSFLIMLPFAYFFPLYTLRVHGIWFRVPGFRELWRDLRPKK